LNPRARNDSAVNFAVVLALGSVGSVLLLRTDELTAPGSGRDFRGIMFLIEVCRYGLVRPTRLNRRGQTGALV
jgi:hypothetical protein